MGTNTTNLNLYKPSVGETGWGTLVNGNFTTLDSFAGAAPDNLFRVVGSADATKKVAFEVDGVTSATTRTVTIPDRNLTLGPTLATEQATTSGTSIDFTGIPPGTRRITILLVGVSTNGTTDPLIQLGDSGGIETAGYVGSGSNTGTSASYTTGFGIKSQAASNIISGALTLTLENAATFMWVATGVFGQTGNTNMLFTAGHKATSGELDRIRLTTTSGTDTFDAGAMNITYE